MSQEALKLLKETEWLLDSRQCPICWAYKPRHFDNCQLAQAIALLEAKPNDDELRICEFCGCNTNAKVRACCNKGREVDEAKPEPTKWDKCQYCGADRIVRPTGQWQFNCECYDVNKRPSQPELVPQVPGEFTKKFRYTLDLLKQYYDSLPPNEKPWGDTGHLTFQTIQQGLEACDLIDRLEAENLYFKSLIRNSGTGPIVNWAAIEQNKSQQAIIARYESHICEAHRPTDLDTSKACPYCEAVKQQAEIERLKSHLKTYGRHGSKCKKTLEDISPTWLQKCTCGFDQALQGDKQCSS